MKRKRFGLWTGLYALAGSLLMSMAALGNVGSLSVSQIVQEGGEALVYISLLDDRNADPLSAIPDPGMLRVCIGDDLQLQPDAVDREEGSEEGFAWIFCLDSSNAVTEEQLEQEKAAVTGLIGQMGEADAGSLITFGGEAGEVFELGEDKKGLEEAVDSIRISGEGPRLYEGMKLALEKAGAKASSYPGRMAVIVFTDGTDESASMVSEGEVQRESIHARVPVYVVGLDGGNLRSVDQIARYSGGMILEAREDGPEACAGKIRKILLSRCRLRMPVPEEPAENEASGWRVVLTDKDGDELTSPSYVFSVKEVKEASSEPSSEPSSEQESSETSGSPEDLTETAAGASEKQGLSGSQLSETGAEKGSEEGPVTPETNAPTEAEAQRPASEAGEAEGKAAQISRGSAVLLIAAGVIAAVLLLFLVFLLLKRRKASAAEKERIESKPESEQKPGFPTGPEREYVPVPVPGRIPEQEQIRIRLLITFGGRREERECMLADQIVLGRGQACDVDVTLGTGLEEGKRTSRKHAVLLQRSGNVFVRDAGAVNRTILNGKPVEGEVPLRKGDVLKLGDVLVQVEW